MGSENSLTGFFKRAVEKVAKRQTEEETVTVNYKLMCGDTVFGKQVPKGTPLDDLSDSVQARVIIVNCPEHGEQPVIDWEMVDNPKTPPSPAPR